jgi:predicted TIM-barrel fold metal-dependent hydrolase
MSAVNASLTGQPAGDIRIISADDHIVEPAHLWASRLPARYAARGPRIVREKVSIAAHDTPDLRMQSAGPSADGQWGDVWYFEDRREPLMTIGAAVGFPAERIGLQPVTFEELRPGCFDPCQRLADMDVAGVQASLCFPNLAPVRFCGQGFLEATDKELARECVRAYNDFVLDEWCAGSGGRLIPCGILPLWDVELAVGEARRVAARGMRALCFSEAPAHLGLPSLHAGYWDPLFGACEETGTVLMVHIGSSSRIPLPSPDAPVGEANLLLTCNASTALVDWLFSGLFVRYPGLKVCLAECQIGWVPYYLQRCDEVWREHRGWSGIGSIPAPPSQYFRTNMYVTFFSDEFGLRNLDAIGPDNVLAETDYPHSDSTWPDSLATVNGQLAAAGISGPTAEKVLRGNAAQLFQLDQ